MPTHYQYMLVQCTVCGNWYLVRGLAGVRVGVSIDDLVRVEQTLTNECKTTHHKGRTRWLSARTTK